MKNFLMTILLLGAALTICGCEMEPPDWDHEASHWSLWLSGTIEKAEIELDNNARKFIIKFIGDNELEANYFHNWKEVIPGAKGDIYKWSSGCTWYMWIPEENIIEEREEIKKMEDKIDPYPEKPKKIISSQKTRPITEKNEWKDIRVSLPTPYQTVLVKTSDGIITTAYIDLEGKWKLETNKNKLRGGNTIYNIEKWILLDL